MLAPCISNTVRVYGSNSVRERRKIAMDNPTHGNLAVEVRGLTKRFKSVEAVKGIDLDVYPGETFGFLGPNGAGKSTTIKILCTLADATSGTARVPGYD